LWNATVLCLWLVEVKRRMPKFIGAEKATTTKSKNAVAIRRDSSYSPAIAYGLFMPTAPGLPHRS
jgi:hypothetical protein